MTSTLVLKNTEILPHIAAPLLRWYHSQARVLPWREEPSPYRVWISEIMLQQTRVEAVKPYFERFLAALPDVRALAAVPDETLMKLWEGLGYYNRAHNLKKAAQIILQKHQGTIPADFEELLQLPGIGRYTAGAISSIAWHQPHPAVDGNVLRVITRIIACPEDILKERTKRAVEQSLRTCMPPDAGAFNQALMELGAMICLPKGTAHCTSCPLLRLCLAFEQERVTEFPYKAAKKNRRIEKLTIFYIECGDKIAIHQRPSQGLLANLWELPNLPGRLTRSEVKKYLDLQGMTPQMISALPAHKHVFSHIEWHMTGWYIRINPQQLKESPSSYLSTDQIPLVWSTKPELTALYSFSSAFHHYLFANTAGKFRQIAK